jgi:malonate decarboxylase gamma subunit
MTLDEILAGLFPKAHLVARGEFGTMHGKAEVEGQGEVAVIGIVDGTPLGVNAGILLAGRVLDIVRAGGSTPIIVLVDTSSQNMTRRDELLGLNEFLAHLSKCLALAARAGHYTIGLLYGRAAAGAFISTALSTQMLAATPDAYPSVMDLPSISRVVKLPLETLQEMAKTTSIFAPGLEPLFATGAVTERWEPAMLARNLQNTLANRPTACVDRRDEIGLERQGRRQARDIAQRVIKQAASYA